LRIWIFKLNEESMMREGDIEVLPEGLKVKPPASEARRILITALLAPLIGPFGAAGFAMTAKGKAFIIPYEKIENVELINIAKLGQVSAIELNFLDDKGSPRSLTFAAAGIIGFKNEKTRKLYEEIVLRCTSSERPEAGAETPKEPAAGTQLTAAALPSEQSLQPLVSNIIESRQSSTAAFPLGSEAVEVSAELRAQGGTLPITSFPRAFGREDFKQFLPPFLLNFIEGKHFTIHYNPFQRMFYIQDLGSRNGTYVNGVDIRGKGLITLKNGDVIVPGKVIELKFLTSAR